MTLDLFFIKEGNILLAFQEVVIGFELPGVTEQIRRNFAVEEIGMFRILAGLEFEVFFEVLIIFFEEFKPVEIRVLDRIEDLLARFFVELDFKQPG
jgi:hypothetical protein